MQPSDTPSRRPDLAITPVTEKERTFTVVHDPRTGRYFRIREIEGFILSQLDGARSLAAIHEAVLREFPGVALSLPTLVGFVEKLGGLGWLVGTEGGRPPRPPLYRRLLRIKLPPVPVDGLFARLLPVVRALYHPLSLTAIGLGMLGVGYWAFFSLEELARAPRELATPGGAALLWLGFTLIAIVHELGHGLTCRYFGARSHGIGFFVLYGIPCFYCDVSGAWTLSSRAQRVAIGLAGLAWQFAGGAIAFVLWKALEPHTLPARLCHVIVGWCGVTALINLNPFIKLDGYYVLTDLLGVPNLREKSLTYLRQRLGEIFLGSAPPRVGSPRERRIFFWFGAASLLYTAVLVWLVLRHVAVWLLERYHGVGALVLGVFAMTFLASWLKSVAGAVRARRGQRAPDAPPPSGPASGGEPPAPRRERPVRPPLRLLLTLGALVGAFAWFWNARWTFFIASPCTLEARERVAVRPRVDGVLQEVRFREGDRVRAGDLFAVLETFDLEKTRERVQQQVAAVEAASDVIRREAPVVGAEKEKAILEARQEVRDALDRLGDRLELFPVRRSEAERRVQEARAALDSAEQVAERLREDERAAAEGRLPPDLQAIADRIERVQAQRALAQKEVQRAAYLVSEGALQRQKLDVAATELRSLEREEAALRSELEAGRKALRERREDAEAEVRRRRAAYEAALEAQRLVERETRPERIETAREEVLTRQEVLETARRLREAARVKEAEAEARRMEARPLVTEIERLEKKIRQARVVAPVSGVVSTPRLEERIGREIARGETIAWIDRIEVLDARIYVDEKEIGEVREGLPVQLRVGAFPDRMFEGRVMEVSPRASSRQGRGAYEVRLRIQNPRGELRPGITGFAKVICGQRPLREVLFRRAYRYIRTEVWTWF